MMSDEYLARFSRQILVPGFDLEGQQALSRARVAIVGCGGLGNMVALYLAAAGIGFVRLIDDDVVDASNLPRQIAYIEDDVGKAKAHVLAHAMVKRASDIGVEVCVQRLQSNNASALLDAVDVVIDATDNRAARLAIDTTTAASAMPWVMGSAVQMTGQNMVFDGQRTHGCYHCLYPQPADEQGSCSELGILSPVVGIVALNQVIDVIKLLSGCGTVPWGTLRLVDFRSDDNPRLRLSPRPNCSLCRKTTG